MTTFVEVLFITATWASTEEPAVIGEPVHLYVSFSQGGDDATINKLSRMRSGKSMQCRERVCWGC